MMTDPEIIDRLSKGPFFQGMEELELEELANLDDHIMEYYKGEVVIRQGEIDRAFFIVLEGSLSVTRNKPPEVFLAHLVPGSLFGELSLRADRARTISVISDDESLAYMVDQDLLDVASPSVTTKIKDRIIDHLITRLDDLNNKLVNFVR